MFASKKANSAEHTSTTLDNRKNSLFFQPRLKVGKPGDKYEAESDKIADTVIEKGNSLDISSPFFSPSPFVQQQTKEEPEPDLQQKPLAENISAMGQILPEEEEVQEKEEESEEVKVQPEELVMQEKKESPVQEKPLASLPVAEIQKKPEELQEMEEEEEEPIQEKSFVQKSDETIPEIEKELQTVQAKTDVNPVVSSSVESRLNGSKGNGFPLPEDTRSEMESGFGTDFGSVRVHTDSAAVQMSKGLGAQAFTHGSDIYFNEGKYNPANNSGKHLLAHELTHTVQQGASIMPKMIQKEDGDSVVEFSLSDGTTINTDQKQMILPMISLPQFKERNADRFPLNMQLRQGDRPRTQQIQFWKNELSPSVISGTDTILNQARIDFGYGTGDDVVFFLKPKNAAPIRIFGNRLALIETFLIPFWNRVAVPTTFQVDHIYEDQMGGYDDIYNYELLEAAANGSAGPTIAAEIRNRIKQAVDGIKEDSVQASSFDTQFTYGTSKSELTRVKNDYEITFTAREFTKPVTGNPDSFWDVLSAVENQHISILQVMSPAEIEAEGLSGSNPERLLVFSSGSGGVQFEIPWGAEQPSNTFVSLESLGISLFSESRLRLIGAQYNPIGLLSGDSVGFLRVQAFASDEETLLQVEGNPTFDWQLDPIPGLEFGGTINRESVAGTIRNSLRLPGLSPIEILESGLHPTKGLMAIGKVLPTVPVISNADIDIVIEGDSIRLRKLINTGEFDLPNPFLISDSSLEIFVGTEGVGVEGNLNFGINSVGEGHIGASASTGGGFELEGAFNFDSELFDPAEINVEYKDNIWTIGGQIGIPEGKVRGVKNATITAAYSENSFSATGEAELDVPGIERGTMSVNYGPEGFSISGNFNLSDDIPGIRGGSVEARVSKAEGAENYDIFVSGTAQPAIPGIDSTLTVTYDNGALTIEGSAAYNRGILSGTINIGATNRAIGDDGQPNGEPDNTMRVYGGGQLNIRITDNFTPQIGAQLTPEGDILINGWVNVDLQIGEGYHLERTLFGIDVTPIPILTIGIAQVLLTAGGSLGIYANINPISINGRIGFENFNPATPESFQAIMEVTARASAEAGLKFNAYLGIMASAAIIYVEGRLAVETSIGAEAGAEIAGGATWSPTRGFEISNATANLDLNISANASLVLHVGAGIYLYVSRVEVWSHDFPIASTNFPPLAQMQASMPVNFENGALAPINADDIVLTNNPLDNPQAAGSFLQGAVTGEGIEPEVAELSDERSRILSEIRQYPSIGPANPDYNMLYSKQFLVEELKINNPDDDWSWLDEELANMEFAEFINFRSFILSQPCSSGRSQEVQMFGIDHPSISQADMWILESELQEQEVECLAGEDIPNDPVP